MGECWICNRSLSLFSNENWQSDNFCGNWLAVVSFCSSPTKSLKLSLHLKCACNSRHSNKTRALCQRQGEAPLKWQETKGVFNSFVHYLRSADKPLLWFGMLLLWEECQVTFAIGPSAWQRMKCGFQGPERILPRVFHSAVKQKFPQHIAFERSTL